MQALWARLATEEARGADGVPEVSLAWVDAGGEEAERGAEVMPDSNPQDEVARKFSLETWSKELERSARLMSQISFRQDQRVGFIGTFEEWQAMRADQGQYCAECGRHEETGEMRPEDAGKKYAHLWKPMETFGDVVHIRTAEYQPIRIDGAEPK